MMGSDVQMFTAYEDDIGAIKLQKHPEVGLVIHIDIHKWTRDNYLQSLRIFNDFMTTLHENGVDQISAGIAPDNTKLMKFATMYGFYDTQIVLKNNQTQDEDDILNLWTYTWEDLDGGT